FLSSMAQSGVVQGAFVDAGLAVPVIVRHADLDLALALPATAVGGLEEDVIDAAVLAAGALRSELGARRADAGGIRAGVAGAELVRPLVLHHADHGDRHRIAVR